MQEERSECHEDMDSLHGPDDGNAESSASGDSVISAVSAAATGARGRRPSRLHIALYALFFSLLAAAIASPILVFGSLRRSEVHKFHGEFRQVASVILSSVGRSVASAISATEGVSLTITSYALDENVTWPFVQLPFFDYQAQSAVVLPQALSVSFSLIIQEEQRKPWEAFAADRTDWIQEALDRQAARRASARELRDERLQNEHDKGKTDANGVPAKSKDGVLVEIYAIGQDGTRYRDTAPAPYAPSWQFLPLSKRGINFNYMSSVLNRPLIEAMMASGKPGFGPPIILIGDRYEQERIFIQFLLRESTGNPDIRYDGFAPLASLFFPIFDDFSAKNGKLVGLLVVTTYWLYYFESILPENSPSVHCVVRDACGRAFTVLIKGGNATFLGMEDKHQTRYDDAVVEDTLANIVDKTEFDFSEVAGPLEDQLCPYTLSVYPTKEFSDRHLSVVPIITAASVSVLFLFAALVLASYEIVLRRRLKRIKKVARESGGLVSELYPAEVRERMLERMRSSRAASVETNRNRFSSVQLVKRALSGSRAAVVIRNVIRVEQERVVRRESLMTLDGGPQEEPIADSFPDCTVMFSYLHGFDEWCTGHDPQDIFVLLEKVFGCLDAIARRYKVFKINTIFDSYFAACGLPRPQPDHALRMSKFARDGLGAVRDLLTTELVDMFGAGTSNMHLRIGLHSGRVTAGLLAVDRVRFDVFGDTVNTSSRIAASGSPGRIHVSPTTAAELVSKFGKSKWLTEREDPVMLKGKGEMTTYWLRPRSADLTKWGSSTSSVLASELESSESTVAVDVHPSKPEFDNSSLGPFGSASSTFSLGLPFQSKSMEMIESRKRGSETLLGLYEQYIEEEEEIVFESDSD